MREELPETESSPWNGGDVALAVVLLLPAADTAAIFGDRARSLGIWGAELAQGAHFLMIGAFFVVPPLLLAGPLSRWRHEITACVFFLCIMFPPWLLSIGSVAIPLSRSMTHEEVITLRETFKIPTLNTSDSDGPCMRLRRSDDRAEIRAYINGIGVIATESTVPGE